MFNIMHSEVHHDKTMSGIQYNDRVSFKTRNLLKTTKQTGLTSHKVILNKNIVLTFCLQHFQVWAASVLLLLNKEGRP